MNSTGVARAIDDLGRVVIPKDLCRSMKINTGDFLEFAKDGENLVLSPCRLQCVFCGNKEAQDASLIEKNGVLICAECAKELSKRVEEGKC